MLHLDLLEEWRVKGIESPRYPRSVRRALSALETLTLKRSEGLGTAGQQAEKARQLIERLRVRQVPDAVIRQHMVGDLSVLVGEPGLRTRWEDIPAPLAPEQHVTHDRAVVLAIMSGRGVSVDLETGSIHEF